MKRSLTHIRTFRNIRTFRDIPHALKEPVVLGWIVKIDGTGDLGSAEKILGSVTKIAGGVGG